MAEPAGAARTGARCGCPGDTLCIGPEVRGRDARRDPAGARPLSHGSQRRMRRLSATIVEAGP